MEVLQCSRKMVRWDSNPTDEPHSTQTPPTPTNPHQPPPSTQAMVAVITFIVPGSSSSVALSMLAVLVLLGVYAYSKPCLSKHDDTMLTISQGSTFVVLLTILMAKNSEGMPGVVVTALLYLSTFVPLAACFYILGSEFSEYRKKKEVAAALEFLAEKEIATAEGGGGGRGRDGDWRRGAIPATTLEKPSSE